MAPEFVDRCARMGPELLVRECLARGTDDAIPLREQAGLGEMKQAR
jgi:hypothetical protein